MRRTRFIAGWCTIGAAAVLAGCSAGSSPTGGPAAAATTGPASAPSAVASAAPVRGRAELWADNCIRCHTSRPPDSYSDAEWGLVMQHMRVRGYLTGQDQRAVEEFLKAAN